MQLLEVKNDTAKISYNPAENYLLPADFLLVEDGNQRLVVQVTGFETSQNKENIVKARPALSIDKDDNMSYYNGYIPSQDAKVMYLNAEEIVELTEGNGEKIFLGSLANKSDCFVKPDISFIDERLYIRSDNEENIKLITQNLVYQLDEKNKRSVIFDFDGSFADLKKVKRLKISENFKLPLNINAFDTILKFDTKECPVADKAVIQSIVLELREYLKTLDDEYLPFTAFKNVVDSEFEENPIPGLMLLKNKLYLYAQDSIFADKKEEFDVIEDAFFNNNIVVIDASETEEKWFDFLVRTVTERLAVKTYMFLSLNEISADKKFIGSLYKNNSLIPVISTSYNSPYSAFLCANAKNHILCKPQNPVSDNLPYSVLLNKINEEEFIIYGSATYCLPLLLNYKTFEDDITEEIVQNEIKKDVDKFFNSSKGVLSADSINVSDINAGTGVAASDIDVTEDDLDFLDGSSSNGQNTENKSDWNDDWNDEWKDEWQDTPGKKADEPEFEILPIEPPTDAPKEDISDLFVSEEEDNLSEDISDKEQNDKEESAVSEDEIFFEEDENEDVIISEEKDDEDLSELAAEENDDNILNEESDNSDAADLTVDESEVDEDGDCVIIPDNEVENVSQEQVLTDDSEAEEDLVVTEEDSTVLSDVIDDIEAKNDVIYVDEDEDSENIVEDVPDVKESDDNEPDNELFVEEPAEDELPPEINENISTNEVPDVKVYETDIADTAEDDDMDFKIGDKVYHPKHGFGVIEGFANYSNKIMFCQIEFENVGRRILDPKVSNLQKA